MGPVWEIPGQGPGPFWKMLVPLAPLSEVALGRQVPEHGQKFYQGGQLGKFLASVQDPSGKCWFPLALLSEVALDKQVPEHAQIFLPRGHVGELQARSQPLMENDGFHGLLNLR